MKQYFVLGSYTEPILFGTGEVFHGKGKGISICTFEDGKIKVKATEAKMARGLMVRYMASNNITDIEDIKKFADLSFKYSAEHSTDKEFVFIKQ